MYNLHDLEKRLRHLAELHTAELVQEERDTVLAAAHVIGAYTTMLEILRPPMQSFGGTAKQPERESNDNA